MFWAFLGISVLIHLLILLQGPSFTPPDIIRPIDFTVRHTEPSLRKMPRIPSRVPYKEPPRQVQRLTFQPVPVTPARPVQANPIRPAAPTEPTHAIVHTQPEALQMPGPKVAKRMPEKLEAQGSNTANAPGHKGNSDTREQYLNTIRGLIEQQKEYPRMARSRQFQGKVIVEFMLTLSGDVGAVKIVEGCRFGILNRAAVQAVEDASPYPKPPPGLFNDNHLLRIPIVFELI